MKDLLYIDLFCGAGGTSSGVNSAKLNGERCAEVIACVNHDPKAIASHAANHPEALHFTEDIRTLDLHPLVQHICSCRLMNPNALIVLWASLECTNFSKAKGGQPRDPDSRTLAEHLFRYIEAIDPDYIQIENVEEFMSWGAVDENGKPISKDKGSSYLRWIKRVKNYGYEFEHRILNAADFGAYTSRKRFFGIFAKKSYPIIFPEATHSKLGGSGLFGSISRWNPVRDVLDLDDEGTSIFNRKKPLAEKTLERIYAGLIKFVAGGKNAFLSKQYSGSPNSKNIPLDEPAGTITTIDHHAFVSVHYGNGFNIPLDNPAPSLTTKDKLSLISVQFIANEYSGGGQISGIDNPNPAVLTNPKQKLVTVKRSNNQFLLNPQFSSSGSSINNPCFTLIARMDKRPPFIVTAKTGETVIEIYNTDSPMMVKIKEFMAAYNIEDIMMRMLKISELLLIMGFDNDYVLIGTQAEQKKFIGNAVEVNIARILCETLCQELRKCKSLFNRTPA